jgi:NAD-dependent dihydropyrimidine dehydrogenase PreA subunit
MIKIDKSACTGCTTCVRVCPHGVLSLNDKAAMIASEENCIECGACQLNCTERAITVTKGTGCLVAIFKEDILGLKSETCTCG